MTASAIQLKNETSPAKIQADSKESARGDPESYVDRHNEKNFPTGTLNLASAWVSIGKKNPKNELKKDMADDSEEAVGSEQGTEELPGTQNLTKAGEGKTKVEGRGRGKGRGRGRGGGKGRGKGKGRASAPKEDEPESVAPVNKVVSFCLVSLRLTFLMSTARLESRVWAFVAHDRRRKVCRCRWTQRRPEPFCGCWATHHPTKLRPLQAFSHQLLGTLQGSLPTSCSLCCRSCSRCKRPQHALRSALSLSCFISQLLT